MMRHAIYNHCHLRNTYRDELKHEVAHDLKYRLKFGGVEPGDRVISSVNLGDRWEVQEENTVSQFIKQYGE